MEKSVDRAFCRFVRGGDPRDLAEVFDATAPELLRVARHLARDAGGAEDLVQDTFAVALEAAPRFDAEQPVLPWLLGILGRRAKRARERSVRRPDPERLSSRAADEPGAEAQRRELSRAVSDAIARLPEAYQPVLMLHLRHGFSAQDIALDVRRAPSTVRKQLARGLARLRRARTTAAMSCGTGLAMRGAMCSRSRCTPRSRCAGWCWTASALPSPTPRSSCTRRGPAGFASGSRRPRRRCAPTAKAGSRCRCGRYRVPGRGSSRGAQLPRGVRVHDPAARSGRRPALSRRVHRAREHELKVYQRYEARIERTVDVPAGRTLKLDLQLPASR